MLTSTLHLWLHLCRAHAWDLRFRGSSPSYCFRLGHPKTSSNLNCRSGELVSITKHKAHAMFLCVEEYMNGAGTMTAPGSERMTILMPGHCDIRIHTLLFTYVYIVLTGFAQHSVPALYRVNTSRVGFRLLWPRGKRGVRSGSRLRSLVLGLPLWLAGRTQGVQRCPQHRKWHAALATVLCTCSPSAGHFGAWPLECSSC